MQYLGDSLILSMAAACQCLLLLHVHHFRSFRVIRRAIKLTALWLQNNSCCHHYHYHHHRFAQENCSQSY